MRPLKLEELIPQPATFTLKQTEKTYHLRPINLDDEVWLQTEFGEGLADILKSIKMKEVSRIVFHQLEDEDKAQFAAKNVTLMDEDGEKQEVRLGGAKLLFALISGYAEKMAVYQALLQTIGISRQLQEELTEEAVREQAQKKSESLDLPTGEKSSIPSPASTDGLSPKSESSP